MAETLPHANDIALLVHQARSPLLDGCTTGGCRAVAHANRTGAMMPPFVCKLSEARVAAVVNYLRDIGGNAAAL
jgi:hypothetical protein